MLLGIIPSSDIFVRSDKFLSNISEQRIVYNYGGFKELYVFRMFGNVFAHDRNILLNMEQEYNSFMVNVLCA